MALNIEKLSRKFIKPFVPTPPTLDHYKMSFIDEVAPFVDVSVVLFFPANNNHNMELVGHLERSLAKTLTRFYQLAGRYVDDTLVINCKDQGADFIHAKVNIKLNDFLGPDMDVKYVDEFIPSTIGASDKVNEPLLATQVTIFECGGVAVGVSGSHRIVDSSTLCTFILEWAATNRQENETEFTGPGFNSSSIFPGHCLRPFPYEIISDDEMSSKYIRKKYSFSETAITKMKAKAIANESLSNRHLSKAQLISAIIWKAFITVDRATYNKSRESMLFQAVNLRGKMASLIPEGSCGNFVAICTTKSGIAETTLELADRLTDNVKKFINTCSKVKHDSEEGQTMVLNSYSLPEISGPVIGLTSWCTFPIYEADFGFGKPIWAAPKCLPLQNMTILMDDMHGSGVEAHLLLQVKDVPYFEEALELQINSLVA